MTLPTCPECEQGKHPNCDSTAWDNDRDRPTTCGCWAGFHETFPLRNPYVGEGVDGARRSAQIDRDEALGMDSDDPRRADVLTSAGRWDDQAAHLETLLAVAKPDPAKALIERIETSYKTIEQERIEAIRKWLADGKKRMLLGTADAALLLGEIDRQATLLRAVRDFPDGDPSKAILQADTVAGHAVIEANRLREALDRTSAALVESVDARNRLAGEVGTLQARVARVEAMHERTPTRYGPDYCKSCSEAVHEWFVWPCPTMAALAIPDGAPQFYEPCVIGSDGKCTRWTHAHS